jgi:transposase InsO family protein
VLRLDNEGGYTSKAFDTFCKEAGINGELTMPYNLQQNEVAKKKNRSIIETSKEMIHDLDLPMCI